MKKPIILLVVLITTTISSFAQFIEQGYYARNLGSNLSNVSKSFCNGNPATSGTTFKLNILGTVQNPPKELQSKKIYKYTNDDDDISYVYIVGKKNTPHRDRDSFYGFRFKRLDIKCNQIKEKGYVFKNLGNNLSEAQKKACAYNVNRSPAFIINVLSPSDSKPLEVGKLYKFNHEDTLLYLYLIYSKNGVYPDRDSYHQTSFSKIKPYCDKDNDGIEDSIDNCPDKSNKDQKDIDNDGVGDVCDNCINNSNSSQADKDNDGIGDSCDSVDNRDSDGDGIINQYDNCPYEKGPLSNNGCPVEPKGDPDFIHSYTDNIVGSGSEFINGELLPTIRQNNYINLQSQMKNAGDKYDGPVCEVDIYVSRSATFNWANSHKLKSKRIDLRNANATGDIFLNYMIPSYSPNPNYGIFSSSGVHYFHFVIDFNNYIKESKEYNNIATKKAYYLHAGNRRNNIYSLGVYNLNGTKIKEARVNNTAEETKLINSLPKGTYIIKSNSNSKIIGKE